MTDAETPSELFLELRVEPAGRQPEIQRGVDERLHVLGTVNLARDRHGALSRDKCFRRVVTARILANQIKDQLAKLRFVRLVRERLKAG
jgi:hypothetical protein